MPSPFPFNIYEKKRRKEKRKEKKRKEKQNENLRDWKGKSRKKKPLFAYDVVFYISNIKDTGTN